MRERAHQIERAVEAHLGHEGHHLVVAHADAVHARVDGQVVRCAQAERIGGLGVLDGELGRVHAGHDLVGQKQRYGFEGRFRQHQDRRVHQPFAQLDGLLHRGDAQVFRARIERRLGTAHRTVPVGVGLDDGHQAACTPDALLDRRRVVADGVQVYLRPRPAPVGGGDEAQLVGIKAGRAVTARTVGVARVLERAERFLACKTGKPVDELAHRISLSAARRSASQYSTSGNARRCLGWQRRRIGPFRLPQTSGNPSARRRPSSWRRAAGRPRCRPSSRARPSRCPAG